MPETLAQLQSPACLRKLKTMAPSLAIIRQQVRQRARDLDERFGVVVVGFFGSRVRGDERHDSDLDVLVDILRPISLLELTGAEQFLGDLLGLRVDLVPRRSVRPELRAAILADVAPP